MPIAEFAYNRTVHSTTSYSPFEVVYGFNPLTPMDLSPLPFSEYFDADGAKKAEFVRNLHERVRNEIEKKNEHFARMANKHRKEVIFQLGDWVWLYLRKERFPQGRKSKLHPKGNGPFQVVRRISNNSY